MPLKPDQNLQKNLLSTTAHMVGEFERDSVLISHAWARPMNANANTASASRTTLLLAVQTQPDPEAPKFIIPDYSYIGEQVVHLLSVLFGKRFDNHGLTEGAGLYRLPDLSALSSFGSPALPINSNAPRADFGVPLDLAEVERICPLFFNSDLHAAARRTFTTAAKFYSQALRNFETDPEVAYLHLITVGEILAEGHEFPVEETLDAKTRHFLGRIEGEIAEGEAIARHFHGRLRSIRRRFVLNLSRLVDAPFFARKEASDAFLALKEACFVKALLAAYDLRSKYVHTGQPFGTWVRPRGQIVEEIQVGKPIVDSKDLAKALADAPTLIGLERVIRYAILRFGLQHGLITECATPAKAADAA